MKSDLGHLPTLSTEVKEGVYAYFCSLFLDITAFACVNLRFDSEESETQFVVLHHCGDNRGADC